MSDTAPDWTEPVMRTGYAARGIVYSLLGGLTMFAAWSGGQTEGTTGALETLKDSPGGIALLYIIAAGLVCYGIWRIIAAYYDLERRGDDKEGFAKRAALVVTGLIHIVMGGVVAGIAYGITGGGGDGAQDMTARVMELPYGRWIVAVVGLTFVGAGIHYALKGWQEKYKRYIRVTETSRQLDPVLRFGFIAYGAVLLIVGLFIALAGVTTDPSEAKGIGDALSYIRGMTFGRILLFLVGFGIVGFGLENFVEAAYRILPRTASDDTETLAGRVDEITS
ncbi:MAG: DUF1206 domain-containing protein [Loktanella sp.]|nr:DUF1206 domain-containing protein [Loktanella sp.]